MVIGVARPTPASSSFSLSLFLSPFLSRSHHCESDARSLVACSPFTSILGSEFNKNRWGGGIGKRAGGGRGYRAEHFLPSWKLLCAWRAAECRSKQSRHFIYSSATAPLVQSLIAHVQILKGTLKYLSLSHTHIYILASVYIHIYTHLTNIYIHPSIYRVYLCFKTYIIPRFIHHNSS